MYFSRGALLSLKTRVLFKYFVHDCRIKSSSKQILALHHQSKKSEFNKVVNLIEEQSGSYKRCK